MGYVKIVMLIPDEYSDPNGITGVDTDALDALLEDLNFHGTEIVIVQCTEPSD